MEITEVRITLRDEPKLKAFANITFDDDFVVRGLKVIEGRKGLFISMPSRRAKDGSYRDIAHPINNEMRQRLEKIILERYEEELENSHDEFSVSSNDADDEFGGESDYDSESDYDAESEFDTEEEKEETEETSEEDIE